MAVMAATGVAIARVRNLFAAAMLSGIFSFAGAMAYIVMDAVDVAFTEAAVGAGVSTVLMLGTLALTKSEESISPTAWTRHFMALSIVVVTGAALIYGSLDMPTYGDPEAPVHAHVAPRYLNQSLEEVGLPNVVTSVLASYRGYDTLGEVFVIFTAATGVLAILGRGPVRRRRESDSDEKETKP